MPAPQRDIIVRPVRSHDATALRDLRVEALRLNPIALTADLAEAEARPPEWWRELVARCGGDGAEVVMIADAGSAGLAGMTGVFKAKQPKLAHAGTVWGVYVREPYRGRGVGEARFARASNGLAAGG
jgi:GNAT superfamily N-acetyltransferase